LYQSVGANAWLVVEREQALLAVTSALVQSAAGQPVVTIQATQDDDGHPATSPAPVSGSP
jgi:hypothetical protein